jgi:hypothetical protein
VNFLRCGIAKLTPGYDRHAFVALLTKLPFELVGIFGAMVFSSSLRFLATGSATGWDAWLRMKVEMSRNRDVCVGCSSVSL